MMKRIIAVILVIASLLSAFALSASALSLAQFPFADVPRDGWSYRYVWNLYYEGIVRGKSNNTFAPLDDISRAEFVKMLGCITPGPTTGTCEEFVDVESGSWYEPFVAWAAEKDIVLGVSETHFAPHAPITREDMAAMLGRYLTNVIYPLEDKIDSLPRVSEPLEFTDGADISDYAADAVREMQLAGIINGFAAQDGSYYFSPEGTATREQACKVIAELYLIIYGEYSWPKGPGVVINYQLNGGTWGEDRGSYSYDRKETTYPQPVREGYEFLGWCVNGSKEPVKVLVVPYPEPGQTLHMTLVACWRNLKDGTLIGPEDMIVPDEPITITPIPPEQPPIVLPVEPKPPLVTM